MTKRTIEIIGDAAPFIAVAGVYVVLVALGALVFGSTTRPTPNPPDTLEACLSACGRGRMSVYEKNVACYCLTVECDE